MLKKSEKFSNDFALSLIMPLFNGLFSSGFPRGKRPLRTKSGKRPIQPQVRKRPVKERGNGPLRPWGADWHFHWPLNGLFLDTPAVTENGPSKKAHYPEDVFSTN